MKVVFLEDLPGTAQVGEVKDVKNGFARNFLLPRRIAARGHGSCLAAGAVACKG